MVDEVLQRETVQHATARSAGEDRRRDPDVQIGGLARGMCVGTDGYPGALRRDDAETLDVEVLAIRVGVDLERGCASTWMSGFASPRK